MENFWRLIPILGRYMIGFLFVFAGISNMEHYPYLIGLMVERGVPFAAWVFWIGIISQILGGLLVIFNTQLIPGVILLIVFIILATFIFHNYWDMQGEARRIHLLELVTNVNMIGGLLVMACYFAKQKVYRNIK